MDESGCEKPWEHTALARTIQKVRERHAANPEQLVRWEQVLAVLINEANEKPVRGGG